MKVSYRLSMMFTSLAVILAIGHSATGSFEFMAGQFWFIAGALLLILLSLVDQPHFSKDANVFINGATALVSLFAIPSVSRSSLWWIFGAWASYLIVASFVLMALRSRELFLESKAVQLFSRLNRAIGRPESIFSAFFLWGIFLQFGYPKDGVTINSLLLFWAVFMILNVPNIAQTISAYFQDDPGDNVSSGVVVGIQSPRIAEVRLSSKLPGNILGKAVALRLESGEKIADGTLFEDRAVKGLRWGRVAITAFGEKWNEVSAGGRIELTISEAAPVITRPVGVAAAGSSIGRLIFEVDPGISLHAGEVVTVKAGKTESYYQIVAAKIADTILAEGNISQAVQVTAGQLGLWNAERATFNPIDWVASAGELVALSGGTDGKLPEGCCPVGHIPNSKFPVHVHISDAVTHNTALIGVTGSGKSYLAFHIIEAMLKNKIKILILDISRQHDLHLTQHKPTALKTVAEVKAWYESDSLIGIHQFGVDGKTYPEITAEFVGAAFTEVSKTKLQRGKNIPAKLCVVFEEAHSLIPEWNQVGQKGDEVFVNKTARVILQGRKFGMGSLIISQRTANVTKTILNQCNTIFALQSFDQTGLDFLRNYMGEEYSHAISTLPLRHAILVGKASSSLRPIIIKITDLEERWKEAQGEKPLTPAEEPNPAEPEPRFRDGNGRSWVIARSLPAGL